MCQSSQDAINRRFNGVLARFKIWSILFEPGRAPGVTLPRIGQLERN